MKTTGKGKRKLEAGVAPVWRTVSKQIDKEMKRYRFPHRCSLFLFEFVDYSEPEKLRDVLNNWHSRGYITHPSFLLELASLFLRCLHSSIARFPRNLQEMKPFFCGAIATTGWIYACGYNVDLPNSQSNMTSLRELVSIDKDRFDIAMETVQLLLACAWKKLSIQPEEVFTLNIATWLEQSRLRAKTGVTGEFSESGLLAMPFYVLLRAIDPDCPNIDTLHTSAVSLEEIAFVELLEPTLYEPENNQCNDPIRFPPAPEDGRNYNLWYFYDCMQPEPF